MAGGAVAVIAYKFLCDGQVGPFSGVRWPSAGEWLHATGGSRACEPRVHACRPGDLPEWIDRELWRVELAGDVRVDCGKLVADRGRLVERVSAWDGELMVAYAEACALRARDAALRVLPAGAAREAVARCATADELAAATERLADLDSRAGRAAGYAGDAARHVLGARSDPAVAPTHAAVSGFIAAHATAFAHDDVGAAPRERAWQAAWIARYAGLPAAPT